MAEELALYQRGWIGYFGKCQTPSVLQSLEEWTRRRLRSVIWKQWKRGTVRFAELRKRGVGRELAAKTAGSAHGPWRLANSRHLRCAAQCLLRLAWDSEIDCRLIAQPAEPPYADPHVRWCDRESGRPPTYVDHTAMLRNRFPESANLAPFYPAPNRLLLKMQHKARMGWSCEKRTKLGA